MEEMNDRDRFVVELLERFVTILDFDILLDVQYFDVACIGEHDFQFMRI